MLPDPIIAHWKKISKKSDKYAKTFISQAESNLSNVTIPTNIDKTKDVATGTDKFEMKSRSTETIIETVDRFVLRESNNSYHLRQKN